MLVGLTIAGFTLLGGAFIGVSRWLILTLLELRVDMAAVKAQNENNGGKTMRDIAERTERTVGALDEKVDAHLLVAAVDSALLRAHLAERH